MRIAIADDHRIVRDGLRWMLSAEEGIELVAEAENGEELLAELVESEVDVVLLDIRMPGASGLEVLAALRSRHPDTKVIMLTMHDDAAFVRKAVELGASGYLLKNAGRDEVMRAIEVVSGGGAYVQGELAGVLVAQAAGGAEDEGPSLSPREREVLQLIARGFENKQIARQLEISEATVKTYLKSVFERLEVRSRAEAVAVGLRLGLIE